MLKRHMTTLQALITLCGIYQEYSVTRVVA